MLRNFILTGTLTAAGIASYFGLLREHLVIELATEQGLREVDRNATAAGIGSPFESYSLAGNRATYRVCKNPDLLSWLDVPQTCFSGDHKHYHRLDSGNAAFEMHELGGGCGQSHTTYLFEVGTGKGNEAFDFIPPKTVLGQAIIDDLRTLESLAITTKPGNFPITTLHDYRTKSLAYQESPDFHSLSAELPLRAKPICWY